MDMRCPQCQSENIYFSKKKQVYICEDCDYVFLPQETRKPLKIFFSYGHDANEPIILRIKQDLEARGHIIWIDKTEIRGGDDWRRKITDGLIDTSAVISFLSAHSVRTPGVCLDELKIALCVKHGYVKTILLESEEHVKVPTTISDVQWLDLSQWKDYYDQGEEIFEAWYQEKLAEICTIIESDEASSFTGEIDQLRNLLKPNLLDTKEHYLLGQQYVGRKWLSDMVDDWLHDPLGSRAFVLVAGPGIGKSCFAANMLHYDPDVLCGLFCEWDKPQTVNTKSVIQTIAFRLAAKLKDYRKLLLNYLEGIDTEALLVQKTPEELFSLLLTNPLNALIDGNRGNCLVVIDGLDEAVSAEGNKLMRILADNLKLLPSWVRFVLTSRPEQGVEQIFKEYAPHILRPDDLMNYHDIKEYLLLNLREELSVMDDKVAVLDRILANSEGSFLYASLVVQGVKNHTLSLAESDHFPVGLSGFYYKNFKRNYTDPAQYKRVRDMIEPVVAAKVFPSPLAEHLGIDTYEYAEAQRSFGSLLTEVLLHVDSTHTIRCITFSHKSILDWLTDAERACEFYIDVRRGARRLTRVAANLLTSYGMKKLSEEPVNPKNLLCKFLEKHLTSYYVNGGCWNELEEFLIGQDTPFLPYWQVLSELPEEWDMGALIARLRDDPASVDYFRYLQHTGEIKLAISLLEKLSEEYGIAGLSLEHFKIFTDLVHLRGEYERAVRLDEEYLKDYTLDEIIESKELMALKSRMLHHSKFFLPIRQLREEVDLLLTRISAESDCEAYLELLIMGGNLGTLLGDMDYARDCNDRTLSVSRRYGKRNFELRAVRKQLDLLKHDRRFDEAFAVLKDYISYDSEPKLRYEVYLLCSMGELYRYTGDFDKAFHCYERVRGITADRGIQGWWAHAVLSLGCLMYDHGHFEEAVSYFRRALEGYQGIGQVWGILTVRLYLMLITLTRGEEISAEEIRDFENIIDKLQYEAYRPYLEKIKQGVRIDFLPLMFI